MKNNEKMVQNFTHHGINPIFENTRGLTQVVASILFNILYMVHIDF